MPNALSDTPLINSSFVKTADRMPLAGVAVKCRLRHCSTHEIQEHLLVRVEEDDCAWRTAGDLCEISYNWDVIEWQEPTDQPHQSA